MKKNIFLIRHAKSSWQSATLSDFERPLNERGERDAPIMGKILKDKGIIPDLIISSTAKRAQQTAKKMAKALGYDQDKIQFEESLYHCSPEQIFQVLQWLDASVSSVFIVAHNPGITHFCNQISTTFSLANMPTCGIVGFSCEAEDWTAVEQAKKEVFLFEYPKKYDEQ